MPSPPTNWPACPEAPGQLYPKWTCSGETRYGDVQVFRFDGTQTITAECGLSGQISVKPCEMQSLNISSPQASGNVTDTTPQVESPNMTNVLYAGQNQDNQVTLNITCTFAPSAAGQYLHWVIENLDGSPVTGWSPPSGTFAGGSSASSIWTESGAAPARQFHVRTFFDDTVTSDPGRPRQQREAYVVIVKVNVVYASLPEETDPPSQRGGSRWFSLCERQ